VASLPTKALAIGFGRVQANGGEAQRRRTVPMVVQCNASKKRLPEGQKPINASAAADAKDTRSPRGMRRFRQTP